MILVLDKRCILDVMVLDPPLVSLLFWFGKALSYFTQCFNVLLLSVLQLCWLGVRIQEWHPACKTMTCHNSSRMLNFWRLA